MATNSSPQPVARREPPVHFISETVSATQASMPAAFDADARSFSSLSHFAGMPL